MSGKTQLHAVSAVTVLLSCCSPRCGSFFLFSLYLLALWLVYCLYQQNGKELLHCQLHKPVQKGSTIHFFIAVLIIQKGKQSGLQLSGETIGCQKQALLALLSEHFVSGQKNNDPLSPDYVPSIFSHVSSTAKRKRAENLHILKNYMRDWMLIKGKRMSYCWRSLHIVWGKQWWSILWASYW